MLKPNDQRLLWKYIDGLTTKDETRYLQDRLKADQQLRHHLRYLQMLDIHLLEGEKVHLPEALKTKILKGTENLSKAKAPQTLGFDKRGLISFAAFNLAVLVFGILIYVYNSGLFSNTSQLSIMRDFSLIIETPMIRSFFAVCIAGLGLLFLDLFLKNRSYGRMTTPV
jgi:hypothetical protein